MPKRWCVMENDERWHLAAACHGMDSEPWFSGNPTKTRRAVAICDRCPVKVICGREADERGEVFGVWGGVVRHKLQGTPVRRIEATVAT
jgi:hypothetical protein